MSDRPINLLLIEEDPIFRLGLVTALLGIKAIAVIAQADSPIAAREQLKKQIPDLVLIEPMNLHNASFGWEFCLELQKNYPSLKICLLTASLDYPRLTIAQTQGMAGYFPKGTAIADLVAGLEKIAAGEVYWSPAYYILKPKVNPKSKFLKPLFQTGLGQIEQSLAEVNSYLAQRPLSDFDQLFWQGRRRELMTARWFVKRLIPDQLQVDVNLANNKTNRLEQSVLTPVEKTAIAASVTNSLPIQITLDKLNFPNLNLTNIPLELDILQPIKRQELLQLVLTQIENVIQELKKLEVTPEQLPDNCNLLLGEIWQSVTLSFFGKYCSP
ncbi:MAG: response regulator, partial [Microcystaceae cyanobacterium]